MNGYDKAWLVAAGVYLGCWALVGIIVVVFKLAGWTN